MLPKNKLKVKLGFGAIPRTVYIFVSAEQDYIWYMLDEKEKQVPIIERSLTGYITGIECNKSVETSMGEKFKTDLHIETDENRYVVRTGRDCWFARSLLISLYCIPKQDFEEPLTITVNQGSKNKKVVFCEIYQGYDAYKFDWKNYEDLSIADLECMVLSKFGKLANRIPPMQPHYIAPDVESSSIDREFYILEIESIIKRRLIPSLKIKGWLSQYYGVSELTQLQDNELIEFKARLQAWVAQIKTGAKNE